MTGYQEMLTDPSYAGQIVVPTYPLIGNYGIHERDFESRRVQVAGFAVREHCPRPSHSLSTTTLDEFLADQGVTGIGDIDTRAVTRRIRTRGVMMGAIAVGGSARGRPRKAARAPALRRRRLRVAGNHRGSLRLGRPPGPGVDDVPGTYGDRRRSEA